MPKRTDLRRILLLGSGPIVIGQAAEFDYSGTQAVKALKEEGYTVVLVNSNPATIMTDPELADRTYIEPVTPEWVRKVIERERPDALLPTMGGQTALNVAMALARRDPRAVRRRVDRGERPGYPDGRGPRGVRRGDAPHRAGDSGRQDGGEPRRRAGRGDGDRLPGDPAALVHTRRHRGRGGVQPGGVRGDGRARARAVARPHDADRALGARLERVRAGGDARLPRQR